MTHANPNPSDTESRNPKAQVLVVGASGSFGGAMAHALAMHPATP